jgi:hypothetical protein
MSNSWSLFTADWMSEYTSLPEDKPRRYRDSDSQVVDPWLRDDDGFQGTPRPAEPDVFNVLDRRGFSPLTPQERAYFRKTHRSPKPHSAAGEPCTLDNLIRKI